jgi:phosphoglycerate-specific signal transduction histidine kinase
MLHHVALVGTDDSEERIAAIISVLRLLVTANVSGSSILVVLMMEVIRASKTLVLTRATQRSIPDYGILHSHRRL